MARSCNKQNTYDVIVIGAGHAGCEAALAAARMGAQTAIFSMNLDSVANMPCNPNIGGTAKGHLVREIDALGGEMGKCADKTLIQSRMLNTAKGPAVFSLRAQIDRRSYQREMKHTLELQENLDLIQAEIIEILAENNRVTGVRSHLGTVYNTKAVILTTGTYLNTRIIIGDFAFNSGPDGLLPANRLSESLKKFGFEIMRFKTGTPARINRRSIDFSKMEEQRGDNPITPFSFEHETIDREQVSCFLTYTTEKTHRIIRENLHRSAMYGGMIEGIGARYCPSIEDKIVRFADKDRHQVFVEPMGLDTEEFYLQGFSTSMPVDVQLEMIRSLPGLENARIMRYAYAIEYDCINPHDLKLSLEYKKIEGLFTAGQINGSSGYEEAAAQGLIAGINAVLKIKGEQPLILDRSEAYIGVLIDDLVTKGTDEPYRMMTSRAEYRLHLRQDNADARLTPIGYKIGLIKEDRYKKFLIKQQSISEEIERLKSKTVPPSERVNEFLKRHSSSQIGTGIKLYDLLKRPEITYEALKEIDDEMPDLQRSVAEQVSVSIKYEGYIAKQLQQIEQFKKMEQKVIPEDIDYDEIPGLRIEARQKLARQRPASVGQASRISGVSPADISVLLIYLNAKWKRGGKQ
ncbi:MAG TPA: tRNA uridine-5-carboxymethylaminomethyl(34) synthesis enzyme MnmG [Ruminiclostridium sp.]|jgi:tRNA uridine 5-carboxymethylaminomethyl modification enzyme|nr:tRNA uridine-5-carboxymethylaminomethyl(34) synthesis enzyme MnmG [Clostridiaceae bacterium]HAA24869.1 tRNA uridine-5-carboxymethylaminomethyl(34) synthesis enzyme MnmG [Ruminiclostridium sp.]